MVYCFHELIKCFSFTIKNIPFFIYFDDFFNVQNQQYIIYLLTRYQINYKLLREVRLTLISVCTINDFVNKIE